MNKIRRFSCYRNTNFTDASVNKVTNYHPSDMEAQRFVKEQSDDIKMLIFAPDVDGWPSNDLALYVSPKTAPEIRQYVQDNLLQPLPRDTMPVDEELAFATAVDRRAQYGSERASFIAGLTEFVQSLNVKENSEG